ncbi:hypothetical protein GCM10010486_02530 [Nonomuraea roseoviolacea subsp. carminata]
MPGRTAPELQARSRHQSLAGLGRSVRLAEEGLRLYRRPPSCGTMVGGEGRACGALAGNR